MKKYRVLLILLVVAMGCGQQTTKGKGVGKASKKGAALVSDSGKKESNQAELNEMGQEKTEEGEIAEGAGKGGEKVKDTLHEILKKKVKSYKAGVEKARSKFEAEGYAFPYGLNGKEVVFNEFERGGHAFPNILTLLMSRGDIRTSHNINNEFYGVFKYDAAFITKLDEIFSKLLVKKDLGFFDSSTSEYKSALFLTQVITDNVGYWNTLLFDQHLSDENLNKLESNDDVTALAKANEMLDKYIESEAKWIRAIKAQIEETALKQNKDEMHEGIKQATGYYNQGSKSQEIDNLLTDITKIGKAAYDYFAKLTKD
ncbi:hypothetical protein [Borrelia sp. RT1S]|uniref:hypothetical protein n=1 Tax=Borrelia sp. RT1S TaxID=2898580 RepID=UPI001E4FABAB|nr:hypothetical protein [Borrelia sp. RT1S]UGQ18004.1 hypothetical protein LSO05_06105 [Borrelia sp. RT1S]